VCFVEKVNTISFYNLYLFLLKKLIFIYFFTTYMCVFVEKVIALYLFIPYICFLVDKVEKSKRVLKKNRYLKTFEKSKRVLKKKWKLDICP